MTGRLKPGAIARQQAEDGVRICAADTVGRDVCKSLASLAAASGTSGAYGPHAVRGAPLPAVLARVGPAETPRFAASVAGLRAMQACCDASPQACLLPLLYAPRAAPLALALRGALEGFAL